MTDKTFTQLLKDWCWIGYLKIDDGWGPKVKIMDKYFQQDPLLGGPADPYFILIPMSDDPEEKSSDPDKKLLNTPINERYKIGLEKNQIKKLMSAIQFIDSVQVNKATWVLENYQPEREVPYRIIIQQVKNKEPIISLVEGEFRPTFSNGKVLMEEILK